MRKSLLIIFMLSTQFGFAQTIQTLDGKWAFTGLRTTLFKVVGEKLFVGMVEYTDTANFNRFVHQLPLDPTIFTEAAVIRDNDTLIIDAKFPAIDHVLILRYTPKEMKTIWFTGDVFLDSSTIISPNQNCNFSRPACINRLFDRSDLKTIIALKTTEAFTRDDAFEFLIRVNGKLKSSCNRCYPGFTDAYMNEIFIDMGFNPIVKRTASRSVWYNTSGFTFFIKTKFSNDQKLIQLSDYIFDSYLK